MNDSVKKILKGVATAAVTLAMLYVVTLIYLSGQIILGTACLFIFALAVYVYTSSRAYTYRYLFPGLAGIAIFIVLPLVFTVRIGFTNRSTSNLLTFERVTNDLLQERYSVEGSTFALQLHRDGDGYRLLFELQDEEEGAEDIEGADFDDLEGADFDDLDDLNDLGDDSGDDDSGDSDSGDSDSGDSDTGDEAGAAPAGEGDGA
ncbi:MAG: hypothetical protein AAGC55_22815, partial [Myxococcota bacterium]